MIETDRSVVRREDDGVLLVEARPGRVQSFELADAQDLVRALGEAGGGRPALVLVDMSPVIKVSREARIYFASAEARRVARGIAFVVGSPIARAVGAFFVRLNAPPFHTKLVESLEAGRAWLRSLPDDESTS